VYRGAENLIRANGKKYRTIDVDGNSYDYAQIKAGFIENKDAFLEVLSNGKVLTPQQ
jgi:hypothetical protein